jgi:hypothetical protein
MFEGHTIFIKGPIEVWHPMRTSSFLEHEGVKIYFDGNLGISNKKLSI